MERAVNIELGLLLRRERELLLRLENVRERMREIAPGLVPEREKAPDECRGREVRVS